jgi:hypothetical protein
MKEGRIERRASGLAKGNPVPGTSSRFGITAEPCLLSSYPLYTTGKSLRLIPDILQPHLRKLNALMKTPFIE